MPSYIYVVIHHLFIGWIKIGKATDPQKRLDSFQTYDPNREFIMLYSRETEYSSKIEAYFKDKHISQNNGFEWYNMESGIAIKSLESILNREDELFGSNRIDPKLLYPKFVYACITKNGNGSIKRFSSIKKLIEYIGCNKKDIDEILKNPEEYHIYVNGYMIFRITRKTIIQKYSKNILKTVQ